MTYKQKKYLVWLFAVITFPLAIISQFYYLVLNTESVYVTFAKFLSLIPGKVGNYTRTSYYMMTLSKCHYDLSVDFASFFAHPNAQVGRKVVIGSFTIIGTANISSNVLISSRVSILSGKFQHYFDGNVASKHQLFSEVSIGENTWIGEGAIVMASIGKDCIVSAGSVVTKNMDNEHTAIGNPARFVNI